MNDRSCQIAFVEVAMSHRTLASGGTVLFIVKVSPKNSATLPDAAGEVLCCCWWRAYSTVHSFITLFLVLR